MIDLVKEIWQTMRSNRLRTLLTGFSVAWGIFMLLLLLGLAQGTVNNSKDFMEKNDPYRITFWQGVTTKPYQGLPEGRRIAFHARSFDKIKNSDPNIKGISTTKYLSGVISSATDYLKNTYCLCAYPERFTGSFSLIDGRFLNGADIDQTRKVIILCKDDAIELFGNEYQAVGKLVKVGDIPFTVVGVFNHEWDTKPCIPYSTAVALSGYKDDTAIIDVHLNHITDTAISQGAQRNVVNSLGKIEKFDPTDNGAVFAYDRFLDMIRGENANKYLFYTMWVIGILTLLTGIVGVSNIMFVSVRERVHEIGIRRAIGARPRQILTQVVLESVALTTVFGYFGIVLGTLGCEIIKAYFAGTNYEDMSPEVNLAIAIEVTVALIIAGALAGIFPALRALRIRPVEALQEE